MVSIAIVVVLMFLVSFIPISFAISINNFQPFEGVKKINSGDVNYYALVIGIEKFAGVSYPDEDHLDESATAWYNMLINNTYNWKKENIYFMLNENATKDKIHDAITVWLDEREDENDVVLIVWEGHGWKLRLSKINLGHACLLTYNETEERRLKDKITDVELDSWLDELESKHVCIILDSCYSGRMLSLRQSGRVLLAAGGKYFFCGVDESDALESGIFSFFLRQGFKGVADINNDGWVTPEESFRYAKIPTIITSIYTEFPFIIEWNNKTIIWFFQVPRMYDRYFGSIPLIKYKYT
jgi:hypothetical protein